METITREKHRLQEIQYTFPYHYIAEIDGHGNARRHRALPWGFEYLCYQHHIIELVNKLSPKKVLEVGCGDGYFIGGLGDNVTCRVGVDYSARAIAFARAFHPHVHFHQGSACNLDDEYDVVAAIEVLEHIPDEDVRGFLRTLFDKTKPEGVVVLSVPSTVMPLINKHYRHYTLNLLRTQLKECGVAHRIVREEFICRSPAWLKILDSIMFNRYWTVEINALSRWIWRRIWNKYRKAQAHNGRHIIMVAEKI